MNRPIYGPALLNAALISPDLTDLEWHVTGPYMGGCASHSSGAHDGGLEALAGGVREG
jgi:hypothetical protein